MSLNLIKLAVGAETLADLEEWQALRLLEKKKAGLPPMLVHLTRHMPKRAPELLDGGSLYWVIKGAIRARQKLIAFTPTHDGDIKKCAIVYDPTVIPVAIRPRQAFQGWRYLEAADAPPDLDPSAPSDDMPEALKVKLSKLGLL
jgi:hypothetical protein